MLTSYHNHSTWSDGSASIREMALAAQAAGVTEFGISDHLVLPPNAAVARESQTWSMPQQRFPEYVQEALAVKAELETPEFQVRVGVEADYFDETIDQLREMLAAQPLDYVIGAVHYAGDFPIDHAKEDWDALPDAAARHAVWEEYLRKLGNLASADFCDFIAHCDLPKKFGERLPFDLVSGMQKAIQKIAQNGLALEINTAGLDKICQEWYPSDDLVQFSCKLNIPFLVNADAHAVSQVVRHFSEARQFLRELGVSEVCSFSQRKRKMISLQED